MVRLDLLLLKMQMRIASGLQRSVQDTDQRIFSTWTRLLYSTVRLPIEAYPVGSFKGLNSLRTG
jgi:hypothetical protein